jgi:phosphohistidine phosphatase
MNLFVIRHAIAEEANPEKDDADRELTADGEKQLKKAVRGLREVGIGFDRILTSPWTRAVRTAKLLKPLCSSAPIATERLCQSPRAELLAQIAELAADTAVVGHEPWLSELVAWLAFGDTRHAEALVIKKAGVCWLEGKPMPGGMVVKALLPPKFMRELGSHV